MVGPHRNVIVMQNAAPCMVVAKSLMAEPFHLHFRLLELTQNLIFLFGQLARNTDMSRHILSCNCVRKSSCQQIITYLLPTQKQLCNGSPLLFLLELHNKPNQR